MRLNLFVRFRCPWSRSPSVRCPGRMCVITVDCFAEEREIHEEMCREDASPRCFVSPPTGHPLASVLRSPPSIRQGGRWRPGRWLPLANQLEGVHFSKISPCDSVKQNHPLRLSRWKTSGDGLGDRLCCGLKVDPNLTPSPSIRQENTGLVLDHLRSDRNLLLLRIDMNWKTHRGPFV